MPRRVAIGVVVSDKMSKTRRVEIPRLVEHAKYGKIIKRRTVCYIHDEKSETNVGDSVEIIECPPRSRLKRWELVKVVAKNRAVDVAAMKLAGQLEEQSKDSN